MLQLNVIISRRFIAARHKLLGFGGKISLYKKHVEAFKLPPYLCSHKMQKNYEKFCHRERKIRKQKLPHVLSSEFMHRLVKTSRPDSVKHLPSHFEGKLPEIASKYVTECLFARC